MEIALNPANKELFGKASRYYYSIGGRWSGKTYDSIQIILYRLLYVPASKACFMRKHYNNIKETLFSDTLAICKVLDIKYNAIRSPLEVTLTNGSRIIYKGLDDAEKSKGLSDVDIILMDEANEFTEMDFETIDQSIRGKNQENSIYLCHNPVPKVPGAIFWFERFFTVDKIPGKVNRYYDESLGSYVSTMRSTYNQNLKCPDNVKKRLEGYKKTNSNLYKLWALGEYAEMKGVIFRNWDVVSEAPAGVDCAGYGLDFGFSSDPAACVKVWINSMEIWVEGILYSTDLTNDDLYDKLKDRIGQYDRIICDSAEPKTKEDLYRKGFKRIEGVKKRANYKSEMANILNGYKIHLIAGDMDLQREFSTWSWGEDKTGKLLPRPKDGNDHYIDAFIMLCHERIGRKSSVLY